jgi:hypothetical protein
MTTRYAYVAAQQVREPVNSLDLVRSTLKSIEADMAEEENRVGRLN